MAANADVLLVTFETQANAYECWIPSADEKGKRSSAAFTAYHPQQSDDMTWELDLDDLTPEPTDDEMAKIKANIERVRNAASQA